jgi:probable rRNA maturation factor
MGLPVDKGERQGSAVQGRNILLARQRTLHFRNRHPDRKVRLEHLRRITQTLMQETWRDGGFDLAICLVAAPEMTRLNEEFLRHKGSTDVITFDYSEKVGQASRLPYLSVPRRGVRDTRTASPASLHGEVVVCLDEAVCQARRFRITWQSELVRYVVHGVLHLLGYSDRNRQARRRMKVAEDALVRRLARRFVFSGLGQTTKTGKTGVQPAYNRRTTEIELK